MNLPDHAVTRFDRDSGDIVLGSAQGLGPVARDTNEWLLHWAAAEPRRTFVAERSGKGWRRLGYGEMLEQVRSVAAWLAGNGFGPETTIAVLSGPGVDHAVLMQAAQYVGAPIVPLAEQYSLIPDAQGRLLYCLDKVNPRLIYADDADKFRAALELPRVSAAMRVASHNSGDGIIPFADLLKGGDTGSAGAAREKVTPDTLAKILFTSGSTSDPKGVPQTQRMLCVNQAQYLSCLPFFGDRAHRVLDWLPWNHVFAGNSTFNMALSNGGSLYLDGGKPVKGLFDKTLENLGLVDATLSFNVPAAYAMLVQAMQGNRDLQKRFFGDLDLIFYAGASLPVDVWTALEDMARDVTGRVPLMTSSWGMTETAPAAIIHHQGGGRSGMIGVPMPELEARLIPAEPGRYELRVRGPNVMAGYYDDPERTAEAFDAEGFFITGDAVRFADPDDMAQGLLFDGRISEEFKLATGTWVSATRLRLEALAALSGLVQDVVVTGADRMEVGLLIFAPPALGLTGDGRGAVQDSGYCGQIAGRLAPMVAKATGSSNRITRALVIDGPPSIGAGEITAKGSLNVRAILERRAAVLERLYDDADAAAIRL